MGKYKRVIEYAVLFIALYAIISFITSFSMKNGATGKNAKIDSATDAAVMFYPKCPSCGHLSVMKSMNLSKGEDGQSYWSCEKCGETYLIEINR